jgi:hypothetical protein
MLLCAGVGKRRATGAAEVEIRARPTFRSLGNRHLSGQRRHDQVDVTKRIKQEQLPTTNNRDDGKKKADVQMEGYERGVHGVREFRLAGRPPSDSALPSCGGCRCAEPQEDGWGIEGNQNWDISPSRRYEGVYQRKRRVEGIMKPQHHSKQQA